MKIAAPYHAGERDIQARVSESEVARRNGAVITDTILQGAVPFIGQQSMVVLGSVDSKHVWSSVVFGAPGFAEVTDDTTIEFDLTQMALTDTDPVWRNIRTRANVGVLFIELHTRRRYRVNGQLVQVSDGQLRLTVEQAYPNCPKYIQRRRLTGSIHNGDCPSAARSSTGQRLGREQSALLSNTDTLFVASADADDHVDASHRGGKPGFVTVLDDRTIRIPDYAGNSMFNTLGNFVVNPNVGIAVLDIVGSRILQLVGRPVVHLDVAEALDDTADTGRYWEVHIDGWIDSELPLTLTEEFFEPSPHNP
jgi:hypothetical protein